MMKGKCDHTKLQKLRENIDANVSKCIKFLEWQASCPDDFRRPADCKEQDDRESKLSVHGFFPKRSAAPLSFDPDALVQRIRNVHASPHAVIFALKKEASRYEKLAAAWHSHFAASRRTQAKEKLKEAQNSMGSMCRILKGNGAGGIKRIITSSSKDGNETKAATSNPQEIDDELQTIWSAITAGNFTEEQARNAGRRFLEKYGDYFVHQEEFKVKDITPDDLAEAIKHSPDNATGLDGVAASDLRLLSP